MAQEESSDCELFDLVSEGCEASGVPNKPRKRRMIELPMIRLLESILVRLKRRCGLIPYRIFDVSNDAADSKMSSECPCLTVTRKVMEDEM